MAPKETSSLLPVNQGAQKHISFSNQDSRSEEEDEGKVNSFCLVCGTSVAVLIGIVLLWSANQRRKLPVGPYVLVERQEGENFLDWYDFYEGADSLGSAGFNNYVGKKRALDLGLVDYSKENGKEFVYIKSAPTDEGPRESIRLEGKRRFDRGLFILDLEHMPTGCGVWPAFWMTDEDAWPYNGEIDIVEGVNMQPQAKTALHTSESCSMFAHVPDYAKTGTWDTATGIPDTFTGELDNFTRVKADNCWNLAPHQWGNQGCVAVNTDNTTLGAPLNENGGGIYALEWDPANGYIKSWVFHSNEIPENLVSVINSKKDKIEPQPESWGLPYGYFAIVSGNRFNGDCPAQAAKWNVKNDPILTCNAWIASDPKALDEAYWKVAGVYVYEREMVVPPAPAPGPNETNNADENA